jgi:hypothetical protein
MSTYSGKFGAAAALGKVFAKKSAPSQYNITLDEFSTRIAIRMLDAIETDLGSGGTGILSVAEIRALDYSVWREMGVGALFPGNSQRQKKIGIRRLCC